MLSQSKTGNVLVCGASGFLGGLVTSALLSEGVGKVFAPLRNGRSLDDLIESIKMALPPQAVASVDFSRLFVLALPAAENFHELGQNLAGESIDEIIHCAGSVDYYDSDVLFDANIQLTQNLLSLAKQFGSARFTFLSTAFSSGFVNGRVAESLHGEPIEDPTEYTKSKRAAEQIIADSGVPYLIIRPSIVVGDSKTGHYAGKPYGLYQFWNAFSQFLCDKKRSVYYFIAPKQRLQLIHQDAFLSSFMAARRLLPDNSIFNQVSNQDTLPTVRQITEQWVKETVGAVEAHYYESIDEVPMDSLDKRSRMWLEFTAINSSIAGHDWCFETTKLDELVKQGLEFADAKLSTAAVCQASFIAQSAKMQQFLKKYPVSTLLPTAVSACSV